MTEHLPLPDPQGLAATPPGGRTLDGEGSSALPVAFSSNPTDPEPAMPINRIISAALSDNAELMRKFGASLMSPEMAHLRQRYQRNLDTIRSEEARIAKARTVEAA